MLEVGKWCWDDLSTCHQGLLGSNCITGGVPRRLVMGRCWLCSIIQFVFFLLNANVNEPLSKVCSWLLKFYHQIISYLLFQTDLPPFPFTDIDGESSSDEVIVDSEIEEDVPEEEKEETS